jgi:hypothetical protein
VSGDNPDDVVQFAVEPRPPAEPHYVGGLISFLW